MTFSNATRLFALLSVVLATPQLGAEEALSMRVTPQVASSPATVSITVTVERHGANRALLVEDDSSAFYRSSLIPLEGDRAARIHGLVFRGLPPGDHRITATVSGVMGERAAVHTTVMVTE